MAHIGWFLFSALTGASETDRFLFDSFNHKTHSRLYISESPGPQPAQLHAFYSSDQLYSNSETEA